mgnify:CR=1 FL=1
MRCWYLRPRPSHAALSPRCPRRTSQNWHDEIFQVPFAQQVPQPALAGQCREPRVRQLRPRGQGAAFPPAPYLPGRPRVPWGALAPIRWRLLRPDRAGEHGSPATADATSADKVLFFFSGTPLIHPRQGDQPTDQWQPPASTKARGPGTGFGPPSWSWAEWVWERRRLSHGGPPRSGTLRATRPHHRPGPPRAAGFPPAPPPDAARRYSRRPKRARG